MRLVATLLFFLLVLNRDSIAQPGPQGDYTLVWSDEFFGTGSPNSTLWFHQTQLPAGGNWFNGEQQHYTNRLSNSSVGNGVLKITARKEIFTDQGHTKQYTSARLNSKFAFTYGRVDVRAKLPIGAGTWPAIWMLGQNIIEPGGVFSNQFGTVSWPACGEIDIMEHWGNNPNVIHGSIHTPSSFGNTVNTSTRRLSQVSTSFFVYSIIWDENKIDFLIDDIVFY
ncbi:MAG: family 16 glycosylhydrolase, partial [Cytophagales bacterium]